MLGTVARMGVTAQQVEPVEHGIDRSSTVFMAGIDEGYAKQAALHYGFQMRAEGYGSDEAVWQALAERDDVAVVTTRWVEEPPEEDAEGSGDRFGRGGRSGGPPWSRGIELQGFYLEEGGTLPLVMVELSNRPGQADNGSGV